MQSSIACYQSVIQDSITKVLRTLEANHSLAKQNEQLRNAIIKETTGGWQWHDAAHALHEHEDLCMGMSLSSLPEDLADSTEQACRMSGNGGSPFLASMLQIATSMEKQAGDSCLLHQSKDTNNICSPGKAALSVKIQESVPAQLAWEPYPFLAADPPEAALGKCRQTVSSSSADVTDSAPAASPLNGSKADRNQRVFPCVLSTVPMAGQLYGPRSEPAGGVERQLECMIGSGEIAASAADLEEQISNQQPPPKTSSERMRTLPPGVTTIVVRNVPARFSQEQLLQLWPPDGTYDLMYLPSSMQNQRRSGLVFINMVAHEAALDFTAKWHGHKIENVVGAKRLHIGVAEVQGFVGNLQHLKASNVARMRNEKLLPVAFKGTQRLDFKSLLAGLQGPASAGGRKKR